MFETKKIIERTTRDERFLRRIFLFFKMKRKKSNHGAHLIGILPAA